MCVVLKKISFTTVIYGSIKTENNNYKNFDLVFETKNQNQQNIYRILSYVFNRLFSRYALQWIWDNCESKNYIISIMGAKKQIKTIAQVKRLSHLPRRGQTRWEDDDHDAYLRQQQTNAIVARGNRALRER